MVPFAIFGLMDSGFGTFRNRLPGGHRARSLAPLFMIIFDEYYIRFDSLRQAFLSDRVPGSKDPFRILYPNALICQTLDFVPLVWFISSISYQNDI